MVSSEGVWLLYMFGSAEMTVWKNIVQGENAGCGYSLRHPPTSSTVCALSFRGKAGAHIMTTITPRTENICSQNTLGKRRTPQIAH